MTIGEYTGHWDLTFPGWRLPVLLVGLAFAAAWYWQIRRSRKRAT